MAASLWNLGALDSSKSALRFLAAVFCASDTSRESRSMSCSSALTSILVGMITSPVDSIVGEVRLLLRLPKSIADSTMSSSEN